MQWLKHNIGPIVITLTAGLLIAFASLPLANTEWAESMRTSSEVEEAGEGVAAEGGEEGFGDGFTLVGSLAASVKFTILTLIGAGLTTFVSWLIRLATGGNKKKGKPTAAT